MKQPMVLFLTRNRFDLYTESQGANIFHFDMSPFVVNLEPANEPVFKEKIKEFVTQNQLPPGNITIVLAEDTLFIKAIPPDSKNEDEDVERFIDSVPFEKVTQMSYIIEGGKLIVATNRELYTAIKHAFENVGFSVSFIIPIFSTNLTIDANTGLDQESAKTILRNIQGPTNTGFDNAQEVQATKSKPKNDGGTKSDKKRLFALAGVFGVLILVLVFVTINSMNSNQKPTEDVVTQPTTIPAVSPTTPPVPEIPVGTSQASPSSLPATNVPLSQ